MKDFIHPDSFQRLCDFCFHQDALLIHSTLEAGLECYLRGLNEKDRKSISAFVDKLLEGKYTAAELKRVWRCANTAIRPKRAEDALKMFQTIRRILDEK